MTSLDLQAWLSLISTVAIMLALVFAGVHVREANRARRDQAAVASLQSAQGGVRPTEQNVRTAAILMSLMCWLWLGSYNLSFRSLVTDCNSDLFSGPI